MERLISGRERKENPEPSSTYSNTSGDSKASSTMSHLLEQIGILKTRNQELLEEHQKALRKYEDKLAEQAQQLAALTRANVNPQEEVVHGSRECHAVKTDIGSAGLQRNLESEQGEKRKLHTMERELGQCRKALSDQMGMSAELRKQLAIAERKIKEMMKTTADDKMEIRSLKSKLHASDQDKTKSRSQNQEIDQLKKTIRQLESKHKTEVHKLTTKFENEAKTHVPQIRQRDALHETLRLQLQGNQQHKALRQELELVTENKQGTQFDLETAQEELRNVRYLISRITEAYSDLTKHSIPLDKYNRLENAYMTTRFRSFRLERRLADRDAVIEHLTELCKQLSEEKLAMKRLMEDLESERSTTSDPSHILDDLHIAALMIDAVDIQIAHLREENHLQETEVDTLVLSRDLYREYSNDVLVSYTISDVEASTLSALQHHLIAQHSRMEQDITELNANKDHLSRELSSKLAQIMESQTKHAALSAQLAEQEGRSTLLEATSKKHLQNVQRLTQALYQNQKDKSHLEEEIARLSDDLEDALRYKEAHADLLSEVVALIQRNELAEAEAERLSQFNVEILSHKNPQQRIYYVDRIRTELAETKNELLLSTREREVLAAAAASLQNELAAYKSIAIPIEQKPAGNRVRVKRYELETLDINTLSPE